jgi:STE24 endopeptidase
MSSIECIECHASLASCDLPIPSHEILLAAFTPGVQTQNTTSQHIAKDSMRLRRLIFAVALCLPLPFSAAAHGAETPAEHAANVYAANEMAAAPVHGNLPDYSLPTDKLAKAQHLVAIRETIHFATGIWGIVSLLLLLWLGTIGWMRDTANKTSRNRWAQGYLFLLLYLIVNFLVGLPLELYDQHMQLKYGFSVQSWASYFGDDAKSFGLAWILGGLVFMLLFWVIRKFPRRWWLVFWGAAIPIVLFGIFVAPYMNLLFNRFEPLQLHNPELVARLEQVVEKGHMNIPPDRMFLMKASEKVTTLNAYVTGFGSSKRVVVWDTSLQKGTPDEVLFIFGHECGHYVLGHIVIGVLVTILTLLVLLFLGYHFVTWAIAKFGARWKVPDQQDWAAFAVLLLAFSIFSALLEPAQAAFSRHDEHAADVYGQEAIHGLVSDPQTVAKDAFDVLGENSLADPNPSPLYELWTYDHPAIGRRAAFSKAYDPWAPRYEPKYFKK